MITNILRAKTYSRYNYRISSMFRSFCSSKKVTRRRYVINVCEFCFNERLCEGIARVSVNHSRSSQRFANHLRTHGCVSIQKEKERRKRKKIEVERFATAQRKPFLSLIFLFFPSFLFLFFSFHTSIRDKG